MAQYDYVKHLYSIPSADRELISRRPVRFGYGILSEIVFYRTYSRLKSDNQRENWNDVTLRCIEGSLSLIKNHLLNHQLPWKDDDWNSVARKMAHDMIDLNWLPPGRGLWGMGELAFIRGSAVLNNCGAATTKDLAKGITWVMDMLMCGCGAGFDTEFKGPVYQPDKSQKFLYVIPDTREGWVESVGQLVQAYTCLDQLFPRFDYSKIRAKGQPIKTFGGTASGPEPLMKLHIRLETYFDSYLAYQEVRNQSAEKRVKIFDQLVDRLKETDFSEEDKAIEKVRRTLSLPHLLTAEQLFNQIMKDLGGKRGQTGQNLIEILHSKLAASTQQGTVFKSNFSVDIGWSTDHLAENFQYIAHEIVWTRLIYIYDTNCVVEHKHFSDLVHSMLDIWQKELINERIKRLKEQFKQRIEEKTYDLTRLTVDCLNAVGACVVAGNVRRSSMLAKGRPDDETFLSLKDFSLNPEREKIAYMSNNSVAFDSTDQYTKYLPACASKTRLNGEPGYYFPLNVNRFGRIGRFHPPNEEKTRESEPDQATIPNPCSEIPLEPFELCNLAEIPINRHLKKVAGDQSPKDLPLNDLFDRQSFARACKWATIYTKSVSILSTHLPETNAVVQRNHRLGVSITGAAQVYNLIGYTNLIAILRQGYKIVRQTDKWLSSILGVRESLRVTTCKPSGTVSLLSGSTPGIHFPHSRYCIRRVRVSGNSWIAEVLKRHNIEWEKDVYADNTLVFKFYLDNGDVRSVKDVSLYEQMTLLSTYQREWSDNMVSVTVTFDPEREGKQIEHAVAQFAPLIKSCSFLPNYEGVYEQMPYEAIDQATYLANHHEYDIDWSNVISLTHPEQPEMPAGCTNDICLLERDA